MSSHDLYAKYVLEREGRETIHEFNDSGDAVGFSNYAFLDEFDGGKALYLVDSYVDPDYRRSKMCYKMAERISQIAVDNQCKWLLTSVDSNTKGVTGSLGAILYYGFELSHVNNNMIYFKKLLEK